MDIVVLEMYLFLFFLFLKFFHFLSLQLGHMQYAPTFITLQYAYDRYKRLSF